MAHYQCGLAIVPGVDYERVERITSIYEVSPNEQFRDRLDTAARGMARGIVWGIMPLGGLPLTCRGIKKTTLCEVGRHYLRQHSKLADMPVEELNKRIIAAGPGDFSAEEIWLARQEIFKALDRLRDDGHTYDVPLTYVTFRQHHRRAVPTFKHYGLPRPTWTPSGWPLKFGPKERFEEFCLYLMTLFDPTMDGRLIGKISEKALLKRRLEVQDWFNHAYHPEMASAATS